MNLILLQTKQFARFQAKTFYATVSKTSVFS